MKRHIVLLAAVILLVAVNVNAQTYPPELAGEQTMFGPERVRLVITAVDGCPWSHAEASGFYYSATLTVTPSGAGILIHGFYSPAGVQVGNSPVQETIVLPWNDGADCYLWEGDGFRFISLTFNGTGFVHRTGRFDPQPHCCPWYEFDTGYCLWVMSAEDPIALRRPSGGRNVAVE
jgi:hypothetical protein